VVKLVVDDEQSNKDAVEEVKKVTERLDIVVANAGQLDETSKQLMLNRLYRHQRTLHPHPHGRSQALQVKL
jgi:NADP-dependent 3-hydroxy acid dehydrogenase YdfG